jgi:hypothetical protein
MNNRVVLCAMVVLVAALAWLWLGARRSPSTPAESASAAAPRNTPSSSAAGSPATSNEAAPNPAPDPSRYEIPNLDDPQVKAAVQWARDMVAKQFGARAGQRYQVNNLSLEFASLAKQATEGDLKAARTLFESLDRCSRAARSAVWLERGLAHHYHDLAKPRDTSKPYDGRSEASIAMNLEDFRRCNGVTDEHLASRVRWGKQLAEAGDYTARRTYYQYGAPKDIWELDYDQRFNQFRDQAWGYLQEQLDGGDYIALDHMASFYANRLTDYRDAYSEYVYLFAYAQAKDSFARYSANARMAVIIEELTPEQVAAAERQGLALYQQCCRR